jgi:hypothetical protein
VKRYILRYKIHLKTDVGYPQTHELYPGKNLTYGAANTIQRNKRDVQTFD